LFSAFPLVNGDLLFYYLIEFSIKFLAIYVNIKTIYQKYKKNCRKGL